MNSKMFTLPRSLRSTMLAAGLALASFNADAQVTQVSTGIAATSATNNFVATAVAPNGDLVAAWRITNNFSVAKWTGSTWSVNTIASSTALGAFNFNDDVDIVVATDGIYHFVVRGTATTACCSQERGVWYGTFNPTTSTWSTFEKIQTYTHASGFMSADNPSIALDASNNPQIVWEYSNADTPRWKEFRLAVKSGSSWTITSHVGTSGDSHGDVVSPRIKINSAGKRYVSFMTNTTTTTLNDKLMCRTDKSGSWVDLTVEANDGINNYGEPNDMVLLNDSTPLIAYNVSGGSTLVKVAQYNGSTWTKTVIDNTNGAAPVNPAVTINASGTIAVAYLKKNLVSTKSDLWIAYKTPSGSWTTQSIFSDAATSMGSYLDITLTDAGRFVVLCHNQVTAGQRDIRYYIGDITGGGSVVVANTAPSISAQSFSIAENSANGTVVGTVAATDAESNPITYSITAGNTGNAFAINGSTGQITVATASQLNYEAATSFALTVSASDGTLASTATVTININNVNEAPTLGAQTFSIDENEPNGTVVGTMTGADVDGNSLTYSITAGNTGGTFAIGSSTGQITVANTSTLNYESTPIFTLTVAVSDGSLSGNATVTINLNDITEAIGNTAPVMADASVTVAEDGNVMLLDYITNNNTGTFADADNDDPQLVKLVSLPSNGIIYQDGGYPAVVNTDYSLAQFSLMYYAPELNFEGTDTFELNASDGTDWAATPSTISITITPSNDAPVLEDLVITTSEDQSVMISDFATGTTFTDIDGDDLASIKIQQVPVNGVLTLFGDVVADGDVVPAHELEQLKYTPAANFSGSDSFVFSASDGNAISANATAYITVSAANDAPTSLALSANSLNENLAAGTTVGSFTATDDDAGDSHYYQLVNGAGDTGNGHFYINGDQLEVANGISFERTAQLSIRVQAIDASGASVEKVIVLDVNDKNDAPTALTLTNNSVSEQQPAGTFVGVIATTDEDGNDTHTLTLVSGTGDADNASFALVNNVLTTAAPLDYIAQQQYSIRVKSEDAAGESVEQVFVINALDENQAPTAITISKATIAEGNAIGALIGILTATDADAGDSHTYELVAGAGDDDNASFQINGSDLEAAASFDFETKSSYSIRVKATDVAGESKEEIIAITITDGLDAPTAVALSNASIDENESLGTVIGGFSTTDIDQASGHVYTFATGVGATDNGSFTIQGNVLYTAAPLNFEAKNSYSIRVRSTDNTGAYSEEVFTINVNDKNEAPTDVTVTIIGVDENSSIGTTAGFLGAIDEDALATHTFTLAPGFGGADNGKFSILANKLQVNASLDYETQRDYAVRLRATDANGAFVEKYVTISVSDVNEAPSALSLSATTIAENEAAGATIGTFSIADQDHADSHDFELVGGNGDDDNASFYISGNMLIANASFNYEVKNSYSIRVSATDLGGLKQEEVFTITIANVADAPVVASLTKQVYKNTNNPFSKRDFIQAYSQEEGKTQKHIKIVIIPSNGQLLYANTPVAVGQIILVDEFNMLSYSPANNFLGTDGFVFAAFDGTTYSADAPYILTVINGRVVGGSVKGADLGNTSITLNTNTVGNQKEEQLTSVEEMPIEISAIGSYPNPFQGVTNITFELPVSMNVTLEVYDLLGRKVDTLVDGEELAGKQTIQWNGNDAGGQYICRLVATAANGEVVTKTINLMQVK